MTDYLSYKWFKARTEVDILAMNHGLTASDLGFYYALMSASKAHLLNGELTLAVVRSVGSTFKLRSWRPSLERLENAGLLKITETGIELDWTGQETRESIEKKLADKAARGVNGRSDIPAMHKAGDHRKCKKPFCEHATEWAKKHAPRSAPSGDSVGSGGLAQSQSQSHKALDDDYEESDGSASPPSPTGRAGALPSSPAPSSEGETSAPTTSAFTMDGVEVDENGVMRV